MEPTKCPQNKEDTIFSKRLESVRKEVECFFGRVKGRFRTLKLPLLFQDKDVIVNVWFTCCILHNLLHAFDGLGELEAGVDWSGREGLHDACIADPETDCLTTRPSAYGTARRVRRRKLRRSTTRRGTLCWPRSRTGSGTTTLFGRRGRNSLILEISGEGYCGCHGGVEENFA